MNRARLLAGLTAAGALGVAAFPASADERTLTVTLLGGKTVTIPIDVPPGTPLDKIQLPGIDTPVVAISASPAPAPVAEHEPGPATERKSGSEFPKRRAKPAARRTAPHAVVDTVRSVARTKAKPKLRLPSRPPSSSNPAFSLALPGPVPVGVPNFFIDRFRIPPFLLPIYQAAGIQYGVRWEILAAINEIETDYGRNLNVSSAGAVGWMQFIPSSWRRYGLDANGDGRKDPYNPVDAIFSAARYLRAANIEKDIRAAIFAYNHADWYVDSVLLRARLIGGLPTDLVGSLTGLTQGRFPVHARATYARPHRGGIDIFSRAGAPVIAVQDGKIVGMGHSSRLGRFMRLRDPYGNTYTYAHLKKIATAYPAPKLAGRAARVRKLDLPTRDPAPVAPASAGTHTAANKAAKAVAVVKPAKERLFANPRRRDAYQAGGAQQMLDTLRNLSRYTVMGSEVYGLPRDDVRLRPLRKGSRVAAGTILGRIGKLSPKAAPHLRFELRPAGRGAPRIDPKPILDGWKLLEATSVYRAKGRNPFFGRDAKAPSIGQILLMSKQALIQRVLANRDIEVYECGRRDIRSGIVDRRVLATLEFLAASGLKPTVTSLRCGHGYYTKSGNVSHHSFGAAVDIAKINGIPIMGHQGWGSVADIAVRRLLTLQGTMKPDQIITLMTYSGTDNTIAMADHADHIHIGWRPLYRPNSKLGRQVNAVLKPNQWIKLIDRIRAIDNPTVLHTPSRFAIKTARAPSARSSRTHAGE
jgi:soluble lytic murein transglycosylase-like protein